MAKLTDGKEWLERTLGDKGRANSLISKGRDQDLFTKGKRGGVAPDLIMADFATLVFCALTSAAPTKVRDGVESLMALQLVGIEIDIGSDDGWQGPYEPEALPDPILDALGTFSLDLRSASQPSAATLAWALILLFMSHTPNHNLSRGDSITVVEQAEFCAAHLTLHQPLLDSQQQEGNRPDFRAIKLVFDNGGFFDPAVLEARRTLYASALSQVADMTKFMGGSNG